jgi:hypothetical protein
VARAPAPEYRRQDQMVAADGTSAPRPRWIASGNTEIGIGINFFESAHTINQPAAIFSSFVKKHGGQRPRKSPRFFAISNR